MADPKLTTIMEEIEAFCREGRDGSITIHVVRGCPKKVATRVVRALENVA